MLAAAASMVAWFVLAALRDVMIATRAVEPPLTTNAPSPMIAAVMVGSIAGETRWCAREQALLFAGGVNGRLSRLEPTAPRSTPGRSRPAIQGAAGIGPTKCSLTLREGRSACAGTPVRAASTLGFMTGEISADFHAAGSAQRQANS